MLIFFSLAKQDFRRIERGSTPSSCSGGGGGAGPSLSSNTSAAFEPMHS